MNNLCLLSLLKLARRKDVIIERATNAICVHQSQKRLIIYEKQEVSVYFFLSRVLILIVHHTVVSNGIWYLVYGVPDGLEVCAKNTGIDTSWIVTHANPPIDSSNKLTTPEFKGQRG